MHPPTRRQAAGLLALATLSGGLFTACESPFADDADHIAYGLINERKRQALGLKSVMDVPQLNLLAVSGGGENGAFGAGLLCGWTAQGTRPTFDWVTGVSTGALTAPFAFLGSAYDPQLRAVYTGLTPSDVLIARSFAAAVFSDAIDRKSVV